MLLIENYIYNNNMSVTGGLIAMIIDNSAIIQRLKDKKQFLESMVDCNEGAGSLNE